MPCVREQAGLVWVVAGLPSEKDHQSEKDGYIE